MVAVRIDLRFFPLRRELSILTRVLTFAFIYWRVQVLGGWRFLVGLFEMSAVQFFMFV